jgi:hypothetical protein
LRIWAGIVLLAAGMASAAPETSPRPVQRPGSGLVLEQTGTIARPPSDAAAQQAASRAQGPERSLRPKERTRKVLRTARTREQMRAKGAVCGDVDIQGDLVGRVEGRIRGCGVENAVRVRMVSGVELSQASVMDCPTAQALKSWIEQTAKPTLSSEGGGLKRLRVAAHYMCRTRNNQPGGRISEHGRGRAIDIAGVRLRDGSLITVQNGWKDKNAGPLLRRLHAGACGPFGTVLGPESDRFHLDHFHFDTARYRNGTYCR